MDEDGKLILDNLPFTAGQHVQVTVVSEDATEQAPGSPTSATGASADEPSSVVDALAILESLVGSVEAPADWADEHDHYLYGTPKRSDRQA